MKSLGIQSIDELPTEELRQKFRKLIEANTAGLEEASPLIESMT